MYGIKINILRFHARVNSIYLLEDNYFLAINISKPTSVSMKMLFHSPNREFSVINSREPLKLSFVNWSSMTFTQFNVFDTTRHMNHLSLQCSSTFSSLLQTPSLIEIHPESEKPRTLIKLKWIDFQSQSIISTLKDGETGQNVINFYCKRQDNNREKHCQKA